jgi:hypothetical protein
VRKPRVKGRKPTSPQRGPNLLSPGRKAWELKPNAAFRSAEGRSRSAKRGATRKDLPQVERAISVLSSPGAACFVFALHLSVSPNPRTWPSNAPPGFSGLNVTIDGTGKMECHWLQDGYKAKGSTGPKGAVFTGLGSRCSCPTSGRRGDGVSQNTRGPRNSY